jgi:hypothetical protein
MKGIYLVHTGYTNRLEMILTMVYAVRNYWAYGLCPSSGVQKQETEEHNVSETGSVSVLMCFVAQFFNSIHCHSYMFFSFFL